MLLGIRFLTDVGSVNTYEFIQQLEISAGDTQDIYFQLIDSSVDRADQGFDPPGRRYMPAANATLKVQLISVECQKSFERQSVQPFPLDDRSIWKLSLLGSDPLKGTVQMKFTLTEPTRTLNFNSGKGTVLRIW